MVAGLEHRSAITRTQHELAELDASRCWPSFRQARARRSSFAGIAAWRWEKAGSMSCASPCDVAPGLVMSNMWS